jgi:bifunctional polynucleotide phosphatase/kinase
VVALQEVESRLTTRARTGDEYMPSCVHCSQGSRDFASNVGITFKTPEEYFLAELPEPFSRNFEPNLHLQPTELGLQGDRTLGRPAPDPLELEDGSVAFKKKNELDIVLFCGSPAAGKSTFYWNWLKPLGYERVNQDTLKTVCRH